jgi:hypothetical protein
MSTAKSTDPYRVTFDSTDDGALDAELIRLEDYLRRSRILCVAAVSIT